VEERLFQNAEHKEEKHWLSNDPNSMLHKDYRLPASTRLIRSQVYTTPYFTLRIAKSNHTRSRFGFVVGKAIDKRATTRNRIRRFLRSCIETLLPDIKDGNDMLFFPKRSILEMKHEDLYNEVQSFMLKQQLLK
jgi:ribonuclease P protein component